MDDKRIGNIHSLEFRALGTEIEIFLVFKNDRSDKDRLFDAIKKIYLEKEKLLSRFDPDSELLKVNSRLGIYQEVSADLSYLSQKSLEYNKLSQGYFDPRILEMLENVGYEKDFKTNDFKSHEANAESDLLIKNLDDDLKIQDGKVLFRRRMDFSGIAKGYITDQVSAYLLNNGHENFLIDSGGDICAHGKNAEDDFWRVEVEEIPEEKIILELKNSAVATSGITRRKWEAGGKKYHHLINPKRLDKFEFDLKSVTVVAGNCEEADVMAKALFLMGKEDGLKYSAEKNIRSIFLDYRGDSYLSKSIKDIIKI